MRIQKTLSHFNRSSLAILCALGLYGNQAYSDEFDASLWGGGSVLGVDFARFNQANAVLPGEYRADIWVNNQLKGHETLRFVDNSEGRAELCLTPELQDVLDLKSAAIIKQGSNEDCVFVKDAIPESTFVYKTGELKLDFEIPQALTVQRPRGYISPKRWQSGTTATFLNYDLNYYRYQTESSISDSLYGNVRAGLNIGSLAFRHTGFYNQVNSRSKENSFRYTYSKYQPSETYVQRDFELLRGNVTLGDFYTSAQVGESFGMRGVRIASDDRMLSPSQRGFAPVVRGVANSNANVTIKQNGNIIYQLSVPAGPFVISDLYPSGYNGDLLVEIQESDGSVRTFTVPFSNVAPLIRVGQYRYQIASGRYRHWNNEYVDPITQATLQYGLFNNLTLNGGVIYSKNYRAALFGFGLNTPIGAFSADSTWSHAIFPEEKENKKGYSLHGTYSINFNSTGTNITLAAYRYSSRHFYTLRDTLAINHRDYIYDEFVNVRTQRPKSQYQFSINQTLGDYGDLYLVGQTYNYWGESGTNNEYQIAYANSYKKLNYNITLSQTTNSESSKRDTAIYINLSLPLGEGKHTVSSSYSRDNSGYSYNRIGVSGTMGEQNQWHYGVNASKNNQQYRAIGANAGYTGRFGSYRMNISQEKNHNRQIGLGASGSIVAHKYGVTLGQQVGDSFAIVRAKDASGALIQGNNQRIDYFGNGIIPYTMPYSINYVRIDPKDISGNIEFNATEQQIIPRANAINLVEFSTHKNVMVLFNLTQSNGENVPMAATAQDDKGNFVGYVVQGGMLFAGQLQQEKGRLTVNWGPNHNEQCYFDYQVKLENLDSLEAQTYDARCLPIEK